MERCQGVAGNCCHQQNSITSQIPSPAKFFNQQNFVAGGAKTQAKIGRMKEKGKAPKCGKQEFATNAIWCQDSNF
jgi:hypothetical protein